ncbi:helix-turn-helix domain-containing protein [Salmonella enterica]|nr:helix-turn-helix domain-containing protein [Salmonella enterica]EIV7025289.1 helix-turn-helix domain-containing protein [Salmonella enterica]EIW3702048.1 helix-turn-helix domain-containing protein [Salmonella enterica]EJF4886053.1 helix-turn-helix domain-containing protein [Salmonella enterica]ELX2875627.1 helix-turn-helix domain-containing protein [Salmonella enterica]
MMKATIGQRILQRRKENKLTQRDLAEAAGVSYASISLWESDKTEPRGKNLHALAEALQCSPTWLLFGDEDKIPGEPKSKEEKLRLSVDEEELLKLYRALPESEQLAQINNLRARVENFNTLFEELLKARKRNQS